MIEEIRNIKSGKKELRNFGSTIGIVLLLIAGVLFYKNNNLFISFPPKTYFQVFPQLLRQVLLSLSSK